MSVTIFRHKKKDSVFEMTKINRKLKKRNQSIGNESYPEDRNEHRQLLLFFRDQTMKFNWSSE